MKFIDHQSVEKGEDRQPTTLSCQH